MRSSRLCGWVLAILIGAFLTLPACTRVGARVGGPCEYETIKGVGKVTAVTVIDNGGQPVTLVDFDWTTDAKDAKPEPMRLAIEELKAGDKEAARRGMTVGSRHQLILEKIVKGTCTPRIWTYVGPAK